MGERSPYALALKMRIHKMIFNKAAERDFSSSPSKTGGATHRRMFVIMMELLKTAGNLEPLYNNFYLAAIDKPTSHRERRLGH
jgi:hypothetical protein